MRVIAYASLTARRQQIAESPRFGLAAILCLLAAPGLAQYWPGPPPPIWPHPGPYPAPRPGPYPAPPGPRPPHPFPNPGGASPIQVKILHVNPVRSPQGPIETVAACLDNTVCGGLLRAAAGSVGVPPQAMRFAGLVGAIINRLPGSEESRYSFTISPGYTLCRVDIRTQSIVPASGERSTHFSISAHARGISIYTWTPERRWGQGRSWYDGYVTLLSVPMVPRMRFCGLNLGKVSWACRGVSGAKGLPGCHRMWLGDLKW